jgi:hypothetical protein
MSNDGNAAHWIEELRQKALALPTPEAVAKASEDRRTWNGRAHSREIVGFNERVARLHGNNARLTAAGLASLNFPTPPDLRDLSYSELMAQIALLDRLLVEQAQTLDRHQDDVEAAQWQAALAEETPIVRMLIRRVEALEAEKAERSARDREIGRAAPARPKPVLSQMGVAMGDGLTVTAPPVARFR